MASREVPAGEPEQQALGKVFENPAGPPTVVPDSAPVFQPTALALNDAPLGLIPGGFAPLGPGGGGGGLIGGGNPGGGNPGGGGENPPPAGPIPEPSTWALMLLGFFFSGYALRRQRACEVSVSHV